MMHHWRIALTSLPLLQRQQPIWHLCRTRHNTRSRRCMRTMLFLPRRRRKVLGGSEKSPTNPTFLVPIGHGVMSSWHNAISQPHPAHKTIQTESSTHEQIDGMVSVPSGVGWWRWKFCKGHRKTDAASNGRVTMGDWLVWGQCLDPNVNQDTIGKLWSRTFDWCDKNMVVFVPNHMIIILKVLNSAGSVSFWLCPD